LEITELHVVACYVSADVDISVAVSAYRGKVMYTFSRDMKPRTQGLHDKMSLLETFSETKPKHSLNL
jgi:hypothetical protein